MTLPIARDLSRELIPRQHDPAGHLQHRPCCRVRLSQSSRPSAPRLPNPARLGNPEEYASLATEMCRNGYFKNGEDVRLDGAIRMAPR